MRRVATTAIFSLVIMSGILIVSPPGSLRAESPQDSSDDEKTYELKYQFKPNSFIHYNVVQNSTVTTQKGDQKSVTVNESKTRKHYRVIYVDEQGNGVLEPVIDDVAIEIRFGEDDVRSWNSRSNDPPPSGPFLEIAKTIGKPLVRLKTTPLGTTLSTTNLTKKTGSSSEDDSSGNKRNNVLITLPEKPIRIGESWKERYETSVLVAKTISRPIQMLRQYTLKSVNDNKASISVTTSVITAIIDPNLQAQLALKQSQAAGTIVFDLAKGTMISRTMECDQRVVGYSGLDSSLHTVNVLTEQLTTSAAVARKAAAKKTQ